MPEPNLLSLATRKVIAVHQNCLRRRGSAKKLVNQPWHFPSSTVSLPHITGPAPYAIPLGSTFQIEESLFREYVSKLRLNRRSDTWIYDHRHHAPTGQKYRIHNVLLTHSLSITLAIGIFLRRRSPFMACFLYFFFWIVWKLTGMINKIS